MWLRTINNEMCYQQTDQKQWNPAIKQQTLQRLVHLFFFFFLDSIINTPARKTLNEFVKKEKKQPVFQLKVIWLSMIKRSSMSNKLHIDFEEINRRLEALCNDRNRWRNLVIK